jgi:hypothetical protein
LATLNDISLKRTILEGRAPGNRQGQTKEKVDLGYKLNLEDDKKSEKLGPRQSRLHIGFEEDNVLQRTCT